MADEIKKPEGENPQPEQTPDAQSEQPEVTIDLAALAEGLKAQAEAAEKKAAEAKDTLLRTVAEYDNFRKRSAREQDAAFDNGVAFAVKSCCPCWTRWRWPPTPPPRTKIIKKA